MDFFQNQDVARKKTGRLVLLFVLAVTGVVVTVGLVAAIAVKIAGDARNEMLVPVVVAAGAAALVIIFLGTAFKTAQLSAGGRVVAESLDGRLVNSSTIDPLERRLVNVVEEMSIASGVPTPPIYILENEGEINAFAAGFAPGDAVVGVTRGTMEQLTRDELQGVIAHEFSHIFNGDMRLNLRLMGLVHGILVIALTGSFLLRILGNTRTRSSSDSKKDGGGLVLALLILGVGLYIVGWIGVVFGRLIKAAVSRQREYLADASAVQFTRNPLGIAGALKRIGGYGGSKLKTPNAEVASHLYFGDGIGFMATSPFATHPPLADRILRLDPAFKGEMIDEPPAVPPGVEEASHPEFLTAPKKRSTPIRTEEAIASIGDPQREHVTFATSIIASVPWALREAAQVPFSARAVVVALLFAENHEGRPQAINEWLSKADPKLAAEVARLLPATLKLPLEHRLPVLDLAFPALQQMSIAQRRAFKRDVDLIAAADERITLFEYTVQRTLLRRLLDEPKPIAATVNHLHYVTGSVARLLGALAYEGDRRTPAFAFDVGASRLGLEITLPSPDECGLEAVDHALEVLHSLSPKRKRRLLDGLAACIGADGKITVSEAELFRAVADALDCPVPPLVAA